MTQQKLDPAIISQLTASVRLALQPEFDRIKGEISSIKEEVERAVNIMRVQQHNSRLSPSDPPMQLLPLSDTGVQQAPEQPICLAQIMVNSL